MRSTWYIVGVWQISVGFGSWNVNSLGIVLLLCILFYFSQRLYRRGHLINANWHALIFRICLGVSKWVILGINKLQWQEDDKITPFDNWAYASHGESKLLSVAYSGSMQANCNKHIVMLFLVIIKEISPTISFYFSELFLLSADIQLIPMDVLTDKAWLIRH